MNNVEICLNFAISKRYHSHSLNQPKNKISINELMRSLSESLLNLTSKLNRLPPSHVTTRTNYITSQVRLTVNFFPRANTKKPA